MAKDLTSNNEIFKRAWGNYVALFEFLTSPSPDEAFNDQKGLIQTYNFASLVPYDLNADNFNNFLLLNAINYVAPGSPYTDTMNHLDDNTKLEHLVPLVPSYSRFLDQMDSLITAALDPSQFPEYNEQEKRVAAAQQNLENYQTYVHDKWSDWLAVNQHIPVDQRTAQRIIWERDNSYSTTIARKRRNVQFANAKLNSWLRSKLPAELHLLLSARTYFDDPGYSIKLPISASHDDPKLANYWREFHMQLPIFNFDEFLANDSVVDKSFTTEENHYSRVETKWKVKAKARWGWFSGGGSAERRKMEEISEKEKFSVNIHFDRFEEVEVYRDKWFEPLLFDTVGKDFAEFWGPGGLLATYPVSLFICRGMKITVEVSDEYTRTLEKFFKGGGSASFGPFFSGGGAYSKDEKYMDFKKTENGFELADGSQTIRLLGSRVRRPNWSDSEAEKYVEGLNKTELLNSIQNHNTFTDEPKS